MSCPFARFASSKALSPADMASLSSYHHAQQAASSSSSSSDATYPLLSEYLKEATAKAHRQVESSAGVKKLMGFGKGASGEDDDGKIFGRMDYIRWMIMLGCIYAAMESSLLSQDVSQAPMLAPLLQAVLPLADNLASSPSSSSDRLLPHLIRLPAILRDIATHLAALAASSGNEEGAGMEWQDLVEECEEQIRDEDDAIYKDLARRLSATLQTSPVSSLHPPHLTPQHVRLLSPTEAESTLMYVKRLQALGDGSGDLLLSHAYVRYLGDLSGGQHICKRVEKLFPLEDKTKTAYYGGYDFYDFPKIDATTSDSDATWHRRLKDTFRTAMDSSIALAVQKTVADGADRSPTFFPQTLFPSSRSRQTARDAVAARLLSSQGSEASLAFELNKDLFDGLIGARPTAVVGSIPSTSQVQPQRPVPYSAHSDGSLSPSSTSSVAGDDTETETDLSDEETESGRGDSHSLLVKHFKQALASDIHSTPAVTTLASPAAVMFAVKASGCPVTRAKRAIVASLPLIATGILMATSAVLLKATLWS